MPGCIDADWDRFLREYKAGLPTPDAVACVRDLAFRFALHDLLVLEDEANALAAAVARELPGRVEASTTCLVTLVLQITCELALQLPSIKPARRANIQERLEHLPPPGHPRANDAALDAQILEALSSWLRLHHPVRGDLIASVLARHLDNRGAAHRGALHAQEAAALLTSLGVTTEQLRDLLRDLRRVIAGPDDAGKFEAYDDTRTTARELVHVILVLLVRLSADATRALREFTQIVTPVAQAVDPQRWQAQVDLGDGKVITMRLVDRSHRNDGVDGIALAPLAPHFEGAEAVGESDGCLLEGQQVRVTCAELGEHSGARFLVAREGLVPVTLAPPPHLRPVLVEGFGLVRVGGDERSRSGTGEQSGA